MKLRHSISALCLTVGLTSVPSVSQAVLLGLAPNFPTINFGSGGMIDYDATSGTVTISGLPSTIFSTNPLLSADIMGTSVDDTKEVTITFQIDNNGNVIPNDINVPDLIITGSIDTDGNGTADFSGTLLTAEVAQFGFADDAAGLIDKFDLRLNNISGNLAYLYTGQDLAVTVDSEASAEYANPFSGSFNISWQAQAKGIVGSTAPITGSGGCHLSLSAKCSVNGEPFKDKCRIKVTRSTKHWERYEYTLNGHTFSKSKYGDHGYPVPDWAANYPTTDVTFQYTVTNDGDNPVSDMLIEDSFDTPISGYPSSLAVGSSFSVTQTIDLNESIENEINVLGSYGSEICGANDVVVIKDKLRERKKYDDDDFKDKGNRE